MVEVMANKDIDIGHEITAYHGGDYLLGSISDCLESTPALEAILPFAVESLVRAIRAI